MSLCWPFDGPTGRQLQDPSYVVGAGADTRVALGCLLDVVNALACVGTAVAVFSVARRQNESLLRHDLAGGPAARQIDLLATGHALLAVRNRTFLFGPNLYAALNALLFGTLPVAAWELAVGLYMTYKGFRDPSESA